MVAGGVRNSWLIGWYYLGAAEGAVDVEGAEGGDEEGITGSSTSSSSSLMGSYPEPRLTHLSSNLQYPILWRDRSLY